MKDLTKRKVGENLRRNPSQLSNCHEKSLPTSQYPEKLDRERHSLGTSESSHDLYLISCGSDSDWKRKSDEVDSLSAQSGNRRRVDTHWFRGNSYFRIGWDWIKAAFSNGWQLLKTVILTSNQDPEPAMASRKQHETRLYRLEFQVQKFVYNAA